MAWPHGDVIKKIIDVLMSLPRNFPYMHHACATQHEDMSFWHASVYPCRHVDMAWGCDEENKN